jgi:hypothetical protein
VTTMPPPLASHEGYGVVEGARDATRQMTGALTGALTSAPILALSRPCVAGTPARFLSPSTSSHVTPIAYGPTILTIPPDDWVRVAHLAETADSRTIAALIEGDHLTAGGRY